MPFQNCSVLFMDPTDLLLSCLSQIIHSNTIMSTLRSFVRTLPFKFHQLLIYWRHVYEVNPIFLEAFTTVDETKRKYPFQALTSYHLAHHRSSERHFHIEILEIDIYNIYNKQTGLRHFDSPSNPCATNWFPCYKETRHLACFDPSGLCHGNSNSPSKCSRL